MMCNSRLYKDSKIQALILKNGLQIIINIDTSIPDVFCIFVVLSIYI